MKKSIIAKYFVVGLFLVMPTVCNADHLFVNALYSALSTSEHELIFNGLATERIIVSYDVYLRGDIRPDDLLAYWGRIYSSIDDQIEMEDALLQIKEIDDARICVIDDETDRTKILSLEELCR